MNPTRTTDYADAACRDSDPEIWYSPSHKERAIAVEACLRCPIREQCLQDSLAAESRGDTQYLFGIYGGMSPNQRRKLLKPVCIMCDGPRPRTSRFYCPPCGQRARASAHARYDAKKVAS